MSSFQFINLINYCFSLLCSSRFCTYLAVCHKFQHNMFYLHIRIRRLSRISGKKFKDFQGPAMWPCAVSSPIAGFVVELRPPKVFHYFQHSGILLIVDYHAAIGGGKTLVPPPPRMPLSARHGGVMRWLFPISNLLQRPGTPIALSRKFPLNLDKTCTQL